MKHLLTIFVFSLLISCTSNEKNLSNVSFFPSLEEQNGLFYKSNFNTPFTGSTESTYSDGGPYVSATFKEGKFHGIYTAWYFNGQKMGETHYRNGKKEGMATAWHENGRKASEVKFLNDERQGKLEVFHPTGEKSTEAFFKADELDSTITQWDVDGNVISVEVYEEGVLIE